MMRYPKVEVCLNGVEIDLGTNFLESLYQILPSPSCSLTASQKSFAKTQ